MTAGNQGRIFISYRRQETAWPARQLYEVLVGRFGADSVFKDVDDIEPGDDFVDRITAAVAACDVLLALIGNQWLTMTDQDGVRRLDNPEDFVRLELRAALSRGVRVVPILVDGAKMPTADQLPPELAPLARRQAVEISPAGFNTDRLLAVLSTSIGTPRPTPVPVADQPPPAPAPLPAAKLPPQDPWKSDSAWTAAALAQAKPEQIHPDEVHRANTEPDEISQAETEPAEFHQAGTPPEEIDPGKTQPVAATASVSAGRLRVPDLPRAIVPLTPAPPTPVKPAATGAGGPGSPETPDLPGTIQRAAGSPPPRPATSRRPLVLVAAGVLVVVLVGVLLVLRPWAGRAGDEASTTAQPGTTIPAETPTAAAGTTDPLILAHRGGLEEHQFETQPAMEAAAAAGFAVETDVRYTSDGVAVLVHDELATKGLDCGGRDIRVSRTTWADLDRYCRSKPTAKDPTRYRVPRLEPTLEGIAAASADAEVFLEVKTELKDERRTQFLATPAKYGLRDRVVITSMRQDWLAAIGKADPKTRLMLFVSGKPVPAAQLGDAGLWGVGVEQGVASEKYLTQLKEKGLKVMIWVLNDPAQWARFVPYRPDILMTAYPARFKEWLTTR